MPRTPRMPSNENKPNPLKTGLSTIPDQTNLSTTDAPEDMPFPSDIEDDKMPTAVTNAEAEKASTAPVSAQSEAPTTPAPLSPAEARLRPKQLAVKRALDAQKKVSIYIPASKNDPKGDTWFFGICGYTYLVKKGVRVEVPEQIADMYYEAIGATDMILNDNYRNLKNHHDPAAVEILG